jgi:hypothetical protein
MHFSAVQSTFADIIRRLFQLNNLIPPKSCDLIIFVYFIDFAKQQYINGKKLFSSKPVCKDSKKLQLRE